jgi:NADPH2:quinone reductase
MKAIRVHHFGGPEVLQLEEVPNLQPDEGEVLVRLRAIGVNPVDTYFRSGVVPGVSLPFTPGFDGAGTVEKVGAGVDVAVGARVYLAWNLSGTYAEAVLCRADQIQPLPEQVSFAQGAGVFIPYATAYQALFHRAKVIPGETVLVHGATGAVGLAAVQLAKAFGCTLIGTGGTEAGRRLVLEQGAQDALDHHRPEHYRQVLELTQSRGVDVILEMVSANLGRDLTVLAPRGRLVVIGDRDRVEIDPLEATQRDATILGMSIGNAAAQEMKSIHAALFVGLANKTLQPVISQELPLAEAPRAHREVLKSGSFGKIVLLP